MLSIFTRFITYLSIILKGFAKISIINKFLTYLIYNKCNCYSNKGFIIKNKEKDLNNQIKNISSILILGGVALGIFYNPIFFFAPALIGLIYSYNKITGKCMLTFILKKMPWN